MSEYPKIEPVADGYEVRIGRKAKLPGLYMNELAAERAVRYYLGQKEQAAKKRKK